VGLWLVQLFTVQEQIKVERPPDGSSVSLSLAVIQNAMDMCHEDAFNGRVLNRQLSEVVKDACLQTNGKSASYKPNLKDKRSATQPTPIKATEQQK